MSNIVRTSLSSIRIDSIRSHLRGANTAFVGANPGAHTGRQPAHTVYGGAQLFKADTAKKMGDTALRSLKDYAPDPASFAAALGQEGRPQFWKQVYDRMVQKLRLEAIEDFRIDFEDGYGTRPDDEEDADATRTAIEVVQGMKDRTLPPFIGIRVKPFSEECVGRSIRTLDIFLSTLLGKSGNRLPSGFVVTLPKITHVEQARALTEILTAIEERNGLTLGTIKFELMVETTQAILDSSGRVPLRAFVEAGEGRCIGAHFGTYDYTAGCGITATHQTMANPVCDFAKHVLQVALAGTPVMLSDGATNIMPVGPHRVAEGGTLTAAQKAENQAVVHRAWRLSYDHIRHSLETGYYQGWDLHPAQLPIRYAAVYAFFLESLESASQRLKAFVEKAAKATLLGDVFDDAATGQGLLNYFLRGIACGAITEEEASDTGLTLNEIRGRSFMKIVQDRTKKT